MSRMNSAARERCSPRHSSSSKGSKPGIGSGRDESIRRPEDRHQHRRRYPRERDRQARGGERRRTIQPTMRSRRWRRRRDQPPQQQFERMVGDLKASGLSYREIGRETGLSQSTIWRCGKRRSEAATARNVHQDPGSPSKAPAPGLGRPRSHATNSGVLHVLPRTESRNLPELSAPAKASITRCDDLRVRFYLHVGFSADGHAAAGLLRSSVDSCLQRRRSRRPISGAGGQSGWPSSVAEIRDLPWLHLLALGCRHFVAQTAIGCPARLPLFAGGVDGIGST